MEEPSRLQKLYVRAANADGEEGRTAAVLLVKEMAKEGKMTIMSSDEFEMSQNYCNSLYLDRNAKRDALRREKFKFSLLCLISFVLCWTMFNSILNLRAQNENCQRLSQSRSLPHR